MINVAREINIIFNWRLNPRVSSKMTRGDRSFTKFCFREPPDFHKRSGDTRKKYAHRQKDICANRISSTPTPCSDDWAGQESVTVVRCQSSNSNHWMRVYCAFCSSWDVERHTHCRTHNITVFLLWWCWCCRKMLLFFVEAAKHVKKMVPNSSAIFWKLWWGCKGYGGYGDGSSHKKSKK